MRPAVFAAVLLSAAAVFAAAPAVACTAVMGWEPWAPYQHRDAAGKLTGLDIELVEAMGKAAGCAVEWREAPWARQVASVEAGELTGAPAASRTAEREAFAVFAKPYRDEAVYLMFPAGVEERSLAQIIAAGGKIGVVNETFYGDDIAKLMNDPATAGAFEKVSSDDNNLRKLAAGRVAAVAIDPFVGQAKARELNLSDQVKLGSKPVYASDIYVMLSKKTATPEIVALWDKALETIQRNGEHGRIIAKYLGGAGS